jgi:DNA mismatch endonuclease, patch repair protein
MPEQGPQIGPRPSSVAVSGRMSAQRSRDTGPEVALRKALYARGLRFRIHWPVPELPRRTIDIAFPGRRVAVFVDGCFWHGCDAHGSVPASNREWWNAKLAKNRARDADTDDHLRVAGWAVVRIWEHEDPVVVADRVETVVRSTLARLRA